jgi:four helix bundle suffix protein
MMSTLIPKYGGYRRLKSFQIAQLVFDITVRFCDKFIDRRSRTHDQMVQAARSGVQNIAEGSQASGTSKKTELKLTNVARASLEELRLDYEDFLRQHKLPIWAFNDPRRIALIHLRLTTANEFVKWAKQQTSASLEEVAANGVLALLAASCSLLDRQLQAQAKAFETEGGFTERLYHYRKGKK